MAFAPSAASNSPCITHLANCPNRNPPTIFSDESEFSVRWIRESHGEGAERDDDGACGERGDEPTYECELRCEREHDFGGGRDAGLRWSEQSGVGDGVLGRYGVLRVCAG